MKSILDYQNYHLVGVKGVAMSALALILTDLGKTVTGSDTVEEFQTDDELRRRRITVYSGFGKENLKQSEVVIYGASHGGIRNPEVSAALSLNLKVLALPEAVGFLTTRKTNVSVCGCHGKTTTSALASYIALKLGLKPSYFVGTSSFMGLSGGRWDEGQMFVTEADEYLTEPHEKRVSKFLFFHPKYLIATNIDYDHPDFFGNISEVEAAFAQFFKKVDNQGCLIVNGDDKKLMKLVAASGKPFRTYGFGSKVDYRITSDPTGAFSVRYGTNKLVITEPRLMGRHNQSNIAACIALFHLMKQDLEKTARYAAEFGGAKRRAELLFENGRNLVFDDYGHHPNEIKATISGLKSRYPDHRLAVCFQPHTFTRTQELLPEFVAALKGADYIGLLPVFPSAREKDNPKIKSELILNRLGTESGQRLLVDDSDWHQMVKETQLRSNRWIYVTMGAGDVYKKTGLIIKYLNQYDGQKT